MTLGERICIARKLKGISQERLGILLGYPKASGRVYINYLEHDRLYPQLHQLRPLCKYLGLNLDALLPEELTPQPPNARKRYNTKDRRE